ncbi:MAG: HD-GYP domain-containing protein, partial [Candidatus Omnitrophota bacterium]
FLVLGDKLFHGRYTKKDINLLWGLSHDVAIAVENALLYEELSVKVSEIEVLYEKEKRIFLSTVIAFATAIDAKDPYTHGHTERVTKYCLLIKEQLEKLGQKFDKDFDKKLQVAALLHDVGKIGTPDYILNKKGPLTKEEYEEIKKHARVGASILQPIEELREVALAIKHHQERWDGLGYPQGLKGEEIPLISRMVMVADAFDALISNRPYREGIFEEMALEEIKKGAGTQFDPILTATFLHAYRLRSDSNIKTN